MKVKNNTFTEKAHNITLNAKNNERIQSTDSIETYPHGTSKNFLYKKDEIKYWSAMKQYKSFDGAMGENIKDHKPNWMLNSNLHTEYE